MTRQTDLDERRAWMLSTGEPGHYIGIGWFDSTTQPVWRAGFPLVSFRTRVEARAALPSIKGPVDLGHFPRARVERVIITVRRA